MKTKSWAVMGLSIGIVGLASACSVDATSGSTEEVVATGEQALCANQDGTNAVLAGLGAATARELHRWAPAKDFQWNGWTNRLELTATGKQRCADGKCFNVQELLNMQSDAAANLVVFPGGNILKPDTLRSRLYSYYSAQMVCYSRPDNHTGDDCPMEGHALKQVSVTTGGCDKMFTFKATAEDGWSLLKEPAQLKNHLWWVGYNRDAPMANPYLSFQSTASTVSIDPTVGLTEGDVTSSGSCTAACTAISSVSLVGQCCSCNGVNKTYSRSPFSYNTYLCR
jgi:hypothetical protein